MSQTINRMYDTPERANQAAGELAKDPFNRFRDVFVTSGTAGEPPEDIVGRMMKAFVLKAHARIFAEKIRQGGALVTVHAPFGTGLAALDVLNSHGPVESGVTEAEEPLVPWDDAAPMSSVLHVPVLLPDSATFSAFWNVPPLTRRGATTSATFDLPELTSSSGPYKGTFGFPLMSNKGTILSSMLGLPVLKKTKPARR